MQLADRVALVTGAASGMGRATAHLFADKGAHVAVTDLDPGKLAVSCTVNGEIRQNGSTADMIWGVAELIEYISRSITLDPGDVIATGTPSGVGVFRDPPIFLEPGDRVRCEIDGIGAVENPVIDWFEDIDDADVVEAVGDFELDDLIGRP